RSANLDAARRAPSARRPYVRVRVDGGATAGVDLEVEVRRAGVASRADVADHLAARYGAARTLEALEVGVEVAGPAVAGEPDREPSEAGRLEVHRAGLDGHQRRAAGRH